MKKMSPSEIELAASALGNQIKAGLPLSEATKRMARLQKKYAPFWREVTVGTTQGNSLSDYMLQVWPPAVCNAIKAGEKTGKLDHVFERIEVTMQIQQEIRSMLMELLYPMSMIIGAVATFLFFMVKVIPAILKAFGSSEETWVTQSSFFLEKLFLQNWIELLIGTVLTIVVIVGWFKKEQNRAKVVDFFVRFPILGEALRNLFFGLWAHYMALISSTGVISLEEGLRVTSQTLPTALQPGLLIMADELRLGTDTAVAGDPDKHGSDDPRQLWPFYVGNSFIISVSTGLLEVELLRAAPAMIKEGRATLKVALAISKGISLLVAGVLLSIPMSVYYMQMGKALEKALH